MIEARLLGQPVLWADGRELEFPTRKGLGLVAYLALEGPTDRSRLADLLWGDGGEERARMNLRQEVYRLRATPLAHRLEAVGGALRLSGGLSTDVARFEAEIGEGRDEAALALYGGPLLDGLGWDDAPGFGEWLLARREALERARQAALARRAEALEAAGDLRGALGARLALLEGEELVEADHREAMRLHHRLGERAAALERFERLRRLLADEYGLTPLPETARLAETVRAAVPPAPSPPPGSQAALPRPPLVGREGAWLAMRRAAGPVLLTGEPGVGKTRLAEEFALAAGPAAVLRGLETSLGTPYYPAAEALRQAAGALDGLEPVWRSEAARLVPELAPPGQAAAPPGPPPPEGRARFLEGLARALAAAAGPGGTLLLDDFHWFDAASAELAVHLARRAGPAGPRLVLAARPLELAENAAANAALAELERLVGLTRVPLEPLDDAGVLAMVQALSGGGAAPFSRRLRRGTGGNPLFVLETLRALFASGGLRVVDGVWRTAAGEEPADHEELPLPASVREAVLGRVDRLGRAARRLLEAASLAGGAFSLEDLAPATALGEWEGLEALERATGAGLLEAGPDGHRFGHDLVRRALDDALSPERRQLLHRRLATSLRGRGAPPARIADHLERGDRAAEAVPWWSRAAEAARAVYAYEDALEHYGRAMRGGLPDREAFAVHAARAELRRALDDRAGWAAEAAAMSGIAGRLADPGLEVEAALARADLDFASARYGAVLAEADRVLGRPGLPAAQEAHALRLGGNALLRLGRRTEAEPRFLAALERAADPVGVGDLNNSLVHCAMQRGDLAAARVRNAAAGGAYRAGGSRRGEAVVLLNEAWIEGTAGDRAGAVATLERALGLARGIGDRVLQRAVLLALAKWQLDADDLAAALPRLEEGLALAREPQDPVVEGMFLTNLAEVHRQRGDLGAALAADRAALALADRVGMAEERALRRIVIAERLLDLGDAAGARVPLEEARDLVEGGDLRALAVWLEAATARLELAAGTPAVAVRRLERAVAASGASPDALGWARCLLGQARLACGDSAGALAAVAGLEDPPAVGARALATRLRAAAAGWEALADVRRAVRLLESARTPPLEKLELGRAAAAALAAAGETKRAGELGRAAQDRALELAATLGPELRAVFLEHHADPAPAL